MKLNWISRCSAQRENDYGTAHFGTRLQLKVIFETMEAKSNPYDLHVLVCTNTRTSAEKKSCGPLGADEIRAELKEWLKGEVERRKLTQTSTVTPAIKCRVNGSGCLDFCSKGIAIAIYPFGEFLLNVDKSNLGDIKANLTKRLDQIASERKTTTPSPADF